ncbi:response regulator transcription factor [Paenibacillus flagellatus]|uniref:DNA-binding response regulator n=1 Tax=Paenibacillus flagellatus TaxID=2211139 RepID=A0A2V5K354_9BACL|nr:response regulator transcription factor [Paenibacillus flagellatus]PYI53082.1 hypothetical protein DLM86_19000 [Paenibacillus flagellatus]
MFKVMIVDDEPHIRKGLRTIIPWESFGFVVTAEAEDGAEALERAESHVPDVVITDIRMPRMDGIELSKELKSRFPDIKVLILSGYNEFAYAKEAMKYGVADYLLKPVDPEELGPILSDTYDRLWERLQHEMKERRRANSLKDFMIGKLIRGEVRRDVRQTAKEYGIALNGQSFRVLIVSMDRYGDMLLSLSGREIGLKRFAVANVLQELLDGGGELFELSEQQFGLLLTEPAPMERESIRRFAETIVDCVGRYVKESVTVAAGPVVSSSGELSASYSGALKALERKFFFDSEHVFVHEAGEAPPSVPTVRWDDAALLKAVREGDAGRIAREAERLLGPLESRVVELEELKLHMMTTIIRLAKLFEEHHRDWQSFYKDKLAEMGRILEYESIPRLKTFLVDISMEIGRYVRTSPDGRADSRVRDIVSHIENRYMDELNLKELSKMFYVNAVYLGQLFKKETGEYFNDYMNKVRIRHAAALLTETELSAAEIAERVGYKYVDHFYRHFKHIHGVNPGEYRKKHASGP